MDIGSVQFNRKSFEKTGAPFEVDNFSRSDRSEFWLNGSRPMNRGPLWPILTGLVISVVWTECPFPFDKIVVPSTSLLFPADKNNNQKRSGLGRVFITGMYRSTGHVEFPKVLLNEKGPIAAYENESIWSAILPRPTIMTIVLFCDDCKRVAKECLIAFFTSAVGLQQVIERT